MFKKLILISTLLISPAFADEAADKAEFNKLYAEFNDLYANSENIDQTIKAAEELSKVAPKVYGKNHKNTATILFNLATLYLEKGESYKFSEYNKKAKRTFEGYFKILDKIEAPKDRVYINHYFSYMKAIASINKLRTLSSHANKVRKIVKEIDYTIVELASIEFSLGLFLFKDGDYKKSLDFIQKSNQYYTEKYGKDHFKVGETYFWIGKLEMGDYKRKKAEISFLRALNSFEKNPEISNSLSQSTHAFLVQLYEDMNQSEKATKHCQAVAEERPKDFDQFIKPLFRKNPTFPQLSSTEISRIKKKSVEILLEFDVDENGFTKNINVVESNNFKFNRSSIAAAEKHRYAPSVKNGQLVTTKGARVRFIYGINN